MINAAEFRSKIYFNKDLINDQTFNGITKKLNTSISFDATEGLGTGASATSTVIQFNVGGFPDQKAVMTAKYVSPTTSSAEDFGIMLRMMSFDSPNQTYYYLRQSAGTAKITRVVANSFTNLTTTAFVLPQNTIVTMSFQVAGNQLSASLSFTVTGSVTDVWLSATDSNITGSFGGMAFRTLNSTGYCRTFTGYQL